MAIIGMGCWLPGAKTPQELWENILAGRREFRRMPDVRTPVSDYYDPTGADPDKYYQSKVAVIDGFEFDWASYRIPESTFQRTDSCQLLALEVADRAFKDAGFSRESLPKDKTGVFVGNTCTGEDMRSNTLRLRWPVIERSITKAGELHGLSANDLLSFTKTAEDCYKSIFPQINEDFLAGSISATIAGRVCNYFDLHGGAFVIDGACASSLATVVTAANMLESNDLDLALAGGVDISLDPFELVGFSRNGALSKSDIRPYDRRGEGFIAGEGGGFVVLKRLDDARRDGDSIYAVIRGWGLASDGKAGIMQPVARQQAAAINRAATSAGRKLAELNFVEGHGTGTRAGDKTELEGLSIAMEMDAGSSSDSTDVTNNTALRSCGIGSLKSLIGHTKAAAGVASLIKATAAVNRRVVPPTAACVEPNDAFNNAADRLYPIRSGEVHASETTMHAGVSAFGFGGINTHLILEAEGTPSPRLATQTDERALLASHQESELFVFGGDTKEDVIAHIDAVADEAPLLSHADLIDLAAELAGELPPSAKLRAAVIAKTADDLATKLADLRRALSEGLPAAGQRWSSPGPDLYIGQGNDIARVGYLFPGQGSQQLAMARTLIERFDWARQLVAQAQRSVKSSSLIEAMFPPLDRARDASEVDAWKEALSATEVAQPAICLASVLCARFLQSIGIQPAVVGGHSLGEISALNAAGVLDEETLFSIVSLRGQVMRGSPDQAGAMASLACTCSEAEQIVSEISGTLAVANINSPNQTVVSGDARAVEAAIASAEARNITCRRLPVSNAFHSPLMAHGAKSFEAALSMPSFPPASRVPIKSGVESVTIDSKTDLRRHLADQITSPVNFVALAMRMKDLCDVFIEVGPGRALSGLCRDIFGEDGICTPLAANAQGWNPNPAVAVAFVNGVNINWSNFYAQRLVRPYIKPSKRVYLSNPAEKPINLNGALQTPAEISPIALSATQPLNGVFVDELGMSSDELGKYLERRGKFLAEVARLDMATLSDESASAGLVKPCETSTAVQTPASEVMTSQAPAAKAPVSQAPVSQAPVSPAPAVPSRLNGSSKGAGKLSRDNIKELLVELVAERTGYPASSLTAEARLLDDLNVDSIKSGELVAEAARRIGAAGAIDATRFANASIGDIAVALHEVAPETEAPAEPAAVPQIPEIAEIPAIAAVEIPPPVNPTPAGNGVSADSVLTILVDLTSERSGYPKSSITADSRFLDDLNLDSIKSGELVAEAARRVGAAGAIDATQFANSSLKDIAAALYEVAPQAAPEPEPAPAVATVAPAPETPPVSSPVGDAEEVSADSVLQLLVDLTSERSGYPKSSITADSRFLDDLNLDSIKSGELVAEAARRIGAAGAIDATQFANASLTNIAAALVDVLPKRAPVMKTPVETRVKTKPVDPVPQSAPPTKPIEGDKSFVSRYPTWTRNYVVNAVPTPREDRTSGSRQGADLELTGSDFLVCYDPTDPEAADALCAQITARGGVAERVSFDSVTSSTLQNGRRFTHHIAVLPRTTSEGAPTERVAKIISRLISLTNVPAATPERPTTVAYVQYGGGFFGNNAKGTEPELCNALSFARTLHLERDDLRVRVLDFATTANTATLAKLVLEELPGAEPFSAVGFDAQMTRRVPVATLSEPVTYQPRAVEWSQQDVILVTGGAKGIMAECALGVARQTGATLVLVGRGEPAKANGASTESEIDKTLSRFRSEGLRHFYYSCDIVDADALANVVRKIEAEAGTITGVIHGASILRPTRTENLTVDGVLQEISPKVLGAWNLCQVLAKNPLKLFASFSSLVVEHGMPWSAGYGFANELMERIVQTAAASSQPIPLQIVSFGLWGQVGRPSVLKTNDHLLSVGLHDGEIPPEEGVRRFVEAFVFDPGVQRLCIYGRSVGYPTWDQLRPEPKVPANLRFVERVLHVEPDVELIARCRLTVDRDLYLHDHVYNGMYIVPTVLALEMLAHAASALVGDGITLSRLDAVEMPYPIIVDPVNGLEIELRAEAQEATTVDGSRRINVSVSSEQTGFKSSVLSGTVVFGARQRQVRNEPMDLSAPVPINPHADLYGRQFFVGPRYQRMRAIYSVDPKDTICAGEVYSEQDIVREVFAASGEAEEERLVLGDPYFRDTLLHSSLLHHLKHMAFTARIDKVELLDGCKVEQTEQRLCVANQKWSADKDAEYELTAALPDGQIVERWSGYCSKALEKQADWPSLQTLLDLDHAKAQDEQHLCSEIATAAKALKIAVPHATLECISGFSDLPREDRHTHERRLAAHAVMSLKQETANPASLSWLSNGRPRLDPNTGLDISFSHEGAYCLCTVGEHAQGCDLAAVSKRSRDDWYGLLGASREPLLLELSEDESFDLAGTRVWAALEAARKSNAALGQELKIIERAESGVLFSARTSDTETYILTLPVRFSHGPQSIVAVTVVSPDHATVSNSDTLGASRIVRDESLGCDVLEYDFNVSWKECTSLSRKTMGAFYVDWFHRAREAMLSPEDSRRWVRGVLDGTTGLLARSIRVQIHDEATAHDELVARVWMTELTDQATAWHVDFMKKDPQGDRKLIASVDAEGHILSTSTNGATQGAPNAAQEYGRFVQKSAPGSSGSNGTGFAELEKGRPTFEAEPGPMKGPLLFTTKMRPSLIDSDLVGNVSSITFFDWLARARDEFLHSLAPDEMTRRAGLSLEGLGEALCVFEKMDYLREAFPFDEITVELKLISASENSAKIHYEFVRQTGETRQKIAVGHQELVWVQRNDNGALRSERFPVDLPRQMTPPPNHLEKPFLTEAVTL
ncbi:MAG: SDR family NAD(P)-dependent oxidoreductase [Filomicrobium sp.]